MDLNVLWTIASSMGTYSDLDMLKNARGFNINFITADRIDKDSVGFELAGKKYIIPKGVEKDYIKSIADICREERITTIVPQYSDELAPMSLSIGLFNSMGVRVLVTEDTEKLIIANNKKKLYQHFDGESFIPRYEYASSVEELERAVKALEYPKYNVCIKPVDGEGGKGFKIITSEKNNIFEDNGKGPEMPWELYKSCVQDISAIPELIVMEYLPGDEYSVDCVCRRGETYVCIPRERIETSMGVATVSAVRNNRELIDISKYIIRKLNLSYNINLQFKYSRAGRPMLVEINPRVSGALVANCGAGVNMLELSLKLAYDKPLGSINVNWDTKMMRYWDQIYVKE